MQPNTSTLKLSKDPVRTRADVTLIYTRLGQPVLIACDFQDKSTKILGYQNLQFIDTQTREYQDVLLRSNIGVLMGPNSNDLVTLDCDCDFAVREIPKSMPWLKDTLATRGNPNRITYWFILQGDYPKCHLQDTIKPLEWRGGRCQTIFEGIHPDEKKPYEIVQDFGPKIIEYVDIVLPDEYKGLKLRMDRALDRPEPASEDCLHLVEETVSTKVSQEVPKGYIEYREEQGAGSSSKYSMYPILREAEVPTTPEDAMKFLDKVMPQNGNNMGGRTFALYKTLLGMVKVGEKGTRNETLVWFAQVAATAMCPQLAYIFMAFWYCYTKSRGNWRETFPSHMKKFRSALETILGEYPDTTNMSPRFTTKEREIYNELDSEKKREAFRIIRNFAVQMPDSTGTFPLSVHELGIRIMMPKRQAHALLRELQTLRVIDIDTKGTQHQAGVGRGKATIWRYLLNEPEQMAA